MVGGSVAVFFSPDGCETPSVLVASASGEVAGSTPGGHTLVPSFAYIPMRETQDFSLLELNVFRELGEELFQMDELESYYSHASVDPAWFTESSAMAAIVESVRRGKSVFWYLSSGVNALNSTFEIHLGLELENSEAVRKAVDAAVGNWEIGRGDDSSTLQFVLLNSPVFLQWFQNADMHPGGAVTVCQLQKAWQTHERALQHL
jgi:hypothetical protein